MNPAQFDWTSPGRIRFGEHSSQELPPIARSLGSRCLLVTGGHPERWDALRDALHPAVPVVATVSVRGEPRISDAIEGALTARKTSADLVVAIGGGSVIDTAKAVAAFATNPSDPFEHLEVIGRGRPLVHPPLPILAIPTTAGAGAEVTRNAVLSSPEHQVKVSLRHPGLLPRVALVDPVLTRNLPLQVTAFSGIDALTQLLEPWVSRRSNLMSDALCEAGLKRIGSALPRVITHPEDAAARVDMSWASLTAGLALANAGLGVIHGFAGPMGGRLPVPHGALCAALAVPGILANIRALEARDPHSTALLRYDQAAAWLTGDPSAHRMELVHWLQELIQSASIPRLSEAGLRPEHLPEIVAAARRSSSMSANPVELSESELLGILAPETPALE